MFSQIEDEDLDKIEIEFGGKDKNLFQILSASRIHKVNPYLILASAFNQKVIYDKNTKLLKKFVINVKNHSKFSKSQLFQDIFADFIIKNKFDKTFFEFGATDGINLSNTFMLENNLDWSGLLSEPSPQWHRSLKKNRNKCKIITDCIWTNSDEYLDFCIR